MTSISFDNRGKFKQHSFELETLWTDITRSDLLLNLFSLCVSCEGVDNGDYSAHVQRTSITATWSFDWRLKVKFSPNLCKFSSLFHSKYLFQSGIPVALILEISATGQTWHQIQLITLGCFIKEPLHPRAQDPLVTTPLAAKVNDRGMETSSYESCQILFEFMKVLLLQPLNG